jgi:hypothetical protein
MGTSRWNTDDYKAYATSTNYLSATRAETFKNSNLPKALDPSKITLRESRDSEQNPMSTPIILALDVTGSMGKYAEIIAKDALPILMQGIYEQNPVTDPHVMFMGVGDVKSDRAPLQVSQFEAGAEVLVSSLRELWKATAAGITLNHMICLGTLLLQVLRVIHLKSVVLVDFYSHLEMNYHRKCR